MRQSDLNKFFKETPKTYAVVRVTKDRKVYLKKTVKKGALGYVHDVGYPAMINVFTGEVHGNIPIPPDHLKIVGYFSADEIIEISRRSGESDEVMSECTHGNMTAHGNGCPWCRIEKLEAALWKLSGVAARLEFGEHEHIDRLQAANYAAAILEASDE